MSLVYEKEFYSNLPMNPSGVIDSIHFARVESIVGNKNNGTIRAKIDKIDTETNNLESLPECYPLLPRFVYAMPKVGEIVLVLLASNLSNKSKTAISNRFWVGPLIFNFDEILKNDIQSSNITSNLFKDKSRNNKTERDIFPIDNQKNDEDTVSIIGRNNTDITQSENKIKLRAGKHKKGEPTKFNDGNPVYNILEYIDENNGYSLTVGDEIYLISHKGRFNFKKIITKDDLSQLKKNSQSMLYGELTVSYLKTLTQAFINHIHQHPQKEPIKDEIVILLESKLNEIQDLLAKNIKIN